MSKYTARKSTAAGPSARPSQGSSSGRSRVDTHQDAGVQNNLRSSAAQVSSSEDRRPANIRRSVSLSQPNLNLTRQIIEPFWDNREIDVSESDESITIKDNKFSLNKTIDDRAVLTNIMTHLASATKQKLIYDLDKKRRHARRLYISTDNVSYRREFPDVKKILFIVGMPNNPRSDSWNLVEKIDIEIQLLLKVAKIDKDFLWRNIVIHADCFISQASLDKHLNSYNENPDRVRRTRSQEAERPRRSRQADVDSDDDDLQFVGVVPGKRK